MGPFDRLRKGREAQSPPEDVGPGVIRSIFEGMGVDERWSVQEERGFTWWGHHLAQRVWAEIPRESHGTCVVKVHAETALWRDLRGPGSNLRRGLFNQMASLSAFVLYPESRKVTLHCAMNLHRGNVSWAGQLLAAAIAIQAADAHIKMAAAEVVQGEADVSAHPQSGPRIEPDEMLEAIAAGFAPAGAGPSPFAKRDFAKTEDLLSRAEVFANADSKGLTAEFPFTGTRPAIMLHISGGQGPLETALLTATSRERHPQLGSGALVRLALPVRLENQAAGRLALHLNFLEATAGSEAHFLGAWCPDDDLGISFVTFLPAATYRPGLLENIVLTAGLRARWARQVLESEGMLPQTTQA